MIYIYIHTPINEKINVDNMPRSGVCIYREVLILLARFMALRFTVTSALPAASASEF
jgi:hypothetical protein